MEGRSSSRRGYFLLYIGTTRWQLNDGDLDLSFDLASSELRKFVISAASDKAFFAPEARGRHDVQVMQFLDKKTVGGLTISWIDPPKFPSATGRGDSPLS